jgi:hypothetical protein
MDNIGQAKAKIQTDEESRAGDPPPFEKQVTITIEGGNPSPANVSVVRGGIVRFTNTDPQDYVIRLFVQGDRIAPDVDQFLPSFDSRTLVAGLELEPNEESTCVYEVIETSPCLEETDKKSFRAIRRRDKKNGGGGTIHVGGN